MRPPLKGIIIIAMIGICFGVYWGGRVSIGSGQRLRAVSVSKIHSIVIVESLADGLMGKRRVFMIPPSDPLVKRFLTDLTDEPRHHQSFPGEHRYLSIRIETDNAVFSGEVYYEAGVKPAYIAIKDSGLVFWTGKSNALAQLLDQYLPSLEQ
jgi:hypothetical protein